MKKIILILSLALVAATSYAQDDRYMFRVIGDNKPQHGNQMRPQHGGQALPQHNGIPWHERYRQEIPCVEDWQGLWNGAHVRLINGKVNIYSYDGDKIIWGDDITLLPNGNYKVRRGDYWRIYDREGVTTSIYGHEILGWWNSTYCVRFNDIWRVYDAQYDYLGVWSRDYIELLWNGCYLYILNGKYYVADASGSRIFNVWGDQVDLMDNGLFRCERNGRCYFYDGEGNEMR